MSIRGFTLLEWISYVYKKVFSTNIAVEPMAIYLKFLIKVGFKKYCITII